MAVRICVLVIHVTTKIRVTVSVAVRTGIASVAAKRFTSIVNDSTYSTCL